MKGIYLEPTEGIGNRMRAIASGVKLSKITKQKLYVVWKVTPQLNCNYNDLFEIPNEFEVIKFNEKYNKLAPIINLKGIKRLIQNYRNKKLGVDYFLNDKKLRTAGTTNEHSTLDRYIKKNNCFYIRTCRIIYPDLSFMSKLKPINEVCKRIDHICNQFDGNTIGVHIRRSDNKIAIENSPLGAFIYQIKQELKQNNKLRFFVASDDITTIRKLREKFGEQKIMIQEGNDPDRTTVEGLQHALVDLYCLSRTKKIYGSYWSSFTNAAALINGIEPIIVKQNLKY